MRFENLLKCSLLQYILYKLIIENYIYFFRYAEQIVVGCDVLILANDNLVPTKVIKLSSFNMQGNHTFDCPFSFLY